MACLQAPVAEGSGNGSVGSSDAVSCFGLTFPLLVRPGAVTKQGRVARYGANLGK